ncbi:proton myo-inositol cotransporter-like [Amphibalanus amphitrite]|uniref:proton myo-inositol cotransporter-like n=1 Tax=Amphibalanus amphitrite TaxID=1232801 RepID=UPI001C92A2D9|nr:proton myo-inositol cotransporter-like [Amphibalanus amphitrite]
MPVATPEAVAAVAAAVHALADPPVSEAGPRARSAQCSDSADDMTVDVSAMAPGPTPAAASLRGHGWLVYLLTVLSAISSLLFGYDTGVVSGAMLLVRSEFHLSDFWHELIVSATVGAAWLSSLLGGYLADRFGRKPVILVAGVLFVVGSLAMALAGGKETLLVGRLIVGLAIGISSMCVPIYISESAPAGIRGLLVMVMTATITLGQLVAALVCGAFSTVDGGWRWMLGLGALPAALQLLGFAFMPESPRFLVAKGREEAAKDVLRRVRGEGDHVAAEYDAIKTDHTAQEAVFRERAAAGHGGSVLSQVVREPSTRRALITGCCLQMFQQISGVNTVIYYSASIITLAGVRDPSTAIWLSAIVSFLSFMAKLVGLGLVERAGRRPILLWSTLGSAVSLVILGAGFQLSASHSVGVTVLEEGQSALLAATCDACELTGENGFCFQDLDSGPVNGSCIPHVSSYNSSASLGRCADPAELGVNSLTWAPDWCPTDYAWLPITGMFLYITMFSPGLGAMPWTITAEIYPLWARSTCNSITTSVNWFFNLIVSLTFLTLIAAITRQGTFYMFCGCTVVGLVVFYVTVPETRGVRLEEIQQLFAMPWGLHAPRRAPANSSSGDGEESSSAQGFENKTFDPS